VADVLRLYMSVHTITMSHESQYRAIKILNAITDGYKTAGARTASLTRLTPETGERSVTAKTRCSSFLRPDVPSFEVLICRNSQYGAIKILQAIIYGYETAGARTASR
jgi:hypothetical protein